LKELAELMEGDAEFDIISDIIKRCDLNFSKYLEDKSLLTPRIFQEKLPKIIKELKLDNPDINVRDPSNFLYLLILGVLILRTGAKVPEILKINIRKATNPKNDIYIFKEEDLKKYRENLLDDLSRKISSHKSGIINPVLEEIHKF